MLKTTIDISGSDQTSRASVAAMALIAVSGPIPGRKTTVVNAG